MAEEPETVVVIERKPLWARIVKWAAIVVAGLAVLLLALIVGLNTGPGKRFIAGQLAGYSTQSGINIRVRGIEGSIYSHMILRGLEVRDQKGVFLTSPEVAIDWHPFAYLHSKIDLDSEPPLPEQAIEQIQQHDQRQAQIMEETRAQQAQMSRGRSL